jgi:16S rRNA (guanine966-N2)-methyltransferase
VRIIAGEFRRRKLLSSPGLTTRPITDRVKETLFERIENDLVDRKVVDVFAGTGSLGLEALSRGATSAVFIESDRQAFELLRQNVAALGVEGRALCWRTDALWSSFHPKGVDAFLPFDAVFFDPPYRMALELAPGAPLFQALSRLARDTVTAPDARLYFRAPEETQLRLPECWRPETSYSISSMEIHVYRKQAATESAEGKGLPPDAEGTGDSPE